MSESYKEIFVTIGITCFNAEKTIEEAIEGALNQEWTNKEIIIVNDGSTDNSKYLIEKKISNHNIVFLENTSNKGASYSRNKIIEKSKGNLICFMDDDDFSDSKRVKLQVEEFIKNGYPKVKNMACCAGLRKLYKNGYFKDYMPMGSKGLIPLGEELANFLLFYEKKGGTDYGFALPTCSLMIDKYCFHKLGFFDLNLRRVEDMDMTIRLSLGKTKFLSVKKILVTQKANISSINASQANYKSEIYLIKKYKSYLDKKGLFSHSILWPELRFNYFNKNFGKCFLILIKIFISNPRRTVLHFSETSLKRFIHDLRNGSILYSFLKDN